MRRQAELLSYQSQTELLRPLRAPYRLHLSVDFYHSAVGTNNPHQRLQQRAFSCPVLTANSTNFAGSHRKGNSTKSFDCTEALRKLTDCKHATGADESFNTYSRPPICRHCSCQPDGHPALSALIVSFRRNSRQPARLLSGPCSPVPECQCYTLYPL